MRGHQEALEMVDPSTIWVTVWASTRWACSSSIFEPARFGILRRPRHAGYGLPAAISVGSARMRQPVRLDGDGLSMTSEELAVDHAWVKIAILEQPKAWHGLSAADAALRVPPLHLLDGEAHVKSRWCGGINTLAMRRRSA